VVDVSYLGTGLFAVALAHTFLVSFFAKLSRKFEKGSPMESFLHLLSEVEVVFGLWAFVFLVMWSIFEGPKDAITYQQSLNMTEPLFIFCILIVASTRPLISLSRLLIYSLSRFAEKVLPFPTVVVQFLILMTLGPLLGSVITEPAAITILALLLYRMIDGDKIQSHLLYGIIGLLFVNISVGGSLTHFAAPPIMIIARAWDWSLGDVFSNLGVAAIVAVVLNSGLFTLYFRKEIAKTLTPMTLEKQHIPLWITMNHILFLIAIVATSHYVNVFFGIFLIFIGFTTVTKVYQDGLKFKEGFLVAFFLGGLVVFGSFQRWWLEPIISSLNETTLFLSATGLTAITDNAALTYLGSQVASITDSSKWALVSGALAGGGLTILANAPNPAGFSILSSKFPDSSLNALKLLMAAFLPTCIAILSFYLLGNF